MIFSRRIQINPILINSFATFEIFYVSLTKIFEILRFLSFVVYMTTVTLFGGSNIIYIRNKNLCLYKIFKIFQIQDFLSIHPSRFFLWKTKVICLVERWCTSCRGFKIQQHSTTSFIFILKNWEKKWNKKQQRTKRSCYKTYNTALSFTSC